MHCSRNILTLTKYHYSSTALAYYDCIVIIIQVTANSGLLGNSGGYTWTFFPFVYFFTNLIVTTSEYLLVLLSLDRFFAFCHLEKSEKYFTFTKIKWYIVLINAFSFIVTFPHLFEMKWDSYPWNTENIKGKSFIGKIWENQFHL